MSTQSTDLCYAGTKLCKAQDPSLLKGKHKTARDKSEAAASVGGAETQMGRSAWLHPCQLCDLGQISVGDNGVLLSVGVRAIERMRTRIARCPEWSRHWCNPSAQ